MAIYYAIKSPSGTFSDFTTTEKTSINRFLRRQGNWDSLWVNWLSCGYTTEEVRLVKEEASRLNKKLDYYRDSSKVIKLRHDVRKNIDSNIEEKLEEESEELIDNTVEEESQVTEEDQVVEDIAVDTSLREDHKKLEEVEEVKELEKDVKDLSDDEYNNVLSPRLQNVEIPESLSRKTENPTVKKFVDRSSNASAMIPDKPFSVPVPKTPKRKQQPKSDLVWPAIIGSSDEDMTAQSKIKNTKNVSKLPAAQYEPQALGSSTDMQFDKVAFSEGGDELSAPRVIKKKSIEEEPIIGRDSIGMKSGGLNLKPLISTPKKDK